MRVLDPDNAFFSTSCIFLPPGDPLSGKHVIKQGCKKCICATIYGEEKPWGCAWFEEWSVGTKDALDRGQMPVVVYKKGQTGEGDETDWNQFPIQFSTDRRGLG